MNQSTNKKSTQIDIPVALIFFSRPDVLEQTFNAIRAARPSKLFLIQDGSRQHNPNDQKNIKKCQQIVNDVDWDCEVFKNYSDTNLGCGMRVSSGISWAFQHVDRLAIIEDDCVPSNSFFHFCQELLEKYKNDERIGMISGMNNLGIYDEPSSDYFFSRTGSIWGWATWKRVWDNFDFNMNWLNEKETVKLLKDNFGQAFLNKALQKQKTLLSGQTLTSWSYQHGVNIRLHSGLIIVPRNNLISNVGLTENGANSLSSIKFTPRAMRQIYYMKTYELDFPLKHPKYIINDVEFKKKLDRLMGNGHPWVRFFRTIESITYRIIYGDFKGLLKGLKRRLKR